MPPAVATSPSSDVRSPAAGHRPRSVNVLALAALGVVFGDIGTSPLYAMQAIFTGAHPVRATAADVYGVISLVAWSLTLMVSLKFVVFVMRADNEGEGGVMALYAGRDTWAAVALGLAMSVKASAFVPLVLLIVAIVAKAPPAKRTRTAITVGGLASATWLVFALPFLQRTNWSLGLVDVAGNDSWMAAGQIVVRVFSLAGTLLGGAPVAGTMETLARLILFGTAATIIVVLARRIWLDPAARRPQALVAAWGWGFLALLLLSPVMYSWYLMWVLPIAWALPRVPRRAVVITSAVLVASQLVTESAKLPGDLSHVNLAFGHPVTIAVALWVGREFLRSIRDHRGWDEDSPGPAFGDRFEDGTPKVGPQPRMTPGHSSAPARRSPALPAGLSSPEAATTPLA